MLGIVQARKGPPGDGNMLGDFARRLEKLEKQVAKLGLGKCNCKVLTFVVPGREDEFDAEMNRSCPVHTFRSLGNVMRVSNGPKGDPPSPRMSEVLAKYKQRQADAIRARAEEGRKIREELLAGAVKES